MMQLAGKAAIVTGSTRGIGEAIASRMAAAGASIKARIPDVSAVFAELAGVKES